MHTALRYCLFGALVASVVSLWTPPWWVIVAAFWAGSVLGLATGLMVHLADHILKVNKCL